MSRSIGLTLILFVTGCDRAPTQQSAPVPMQKSATEFAFNHPASEEVNQLFLRLDVYSEEDYRQLARRDRFVWDVSWFEAEVMNGGLDQYFYNSTGDHSANCLEALKAINAKESHALLKSACDLFPDGQPSPDRAVRQEQLRKITGERGYLDDMIDNGDIEYELYQLLLDYWKAADPNEL